MPLTLLTPPTVDPVSLADAKAFCKVTHDDEDTLFQSLITAGARHLERELNISFSQQQWRLSLNWFADHIILPRGPVISIDAVKYLDEDGVEQDLATGIYLPDLEGERQNLVRAIGAAFPATGQLPNAVSVTYTAGMNDVETHKDLWLALQFQIQHFYVRGIDSAETPAIVATLAQPYRRFL